MKRIICFVLVLAAMLGLCSCNVATTENAEVIEPKIELTYGEKYINVADVGAVNGKQEYYIFYEDGTADRHIYNKPSATVVQSYTAHYVFEEVPEENMIFCFYNGVDYDPAHNTSDASTTQRSTLVCSENIVMDVNGYTYVLESYLEKIPNYGK